MKKNMVYFNDKQMEILERFEPVFNTVLYQQYKKGTTMAQNNLMADILEELTGKPVSRNFSCNSCLFEIWRNGARHYYATKEHNEEINNNKVTEEPTPTEEEADVTETVTETDATGDSESEVREESGTDGKERRETRRSNSRRNSKG